MYIYFSCKPIELPIVTDHDDTEVFILGEGKIIDLHFIVTSFT